MAGVIYRTIPGPVNVTLQQGSLVQILVEAMGRINYGGAIYDFKGIVGSVR